MGEYFTNQNKVDFVEREGQQQKNSDGYISCDNCLSIIKKVLPDFSETRITEILSDHDVEGTGQIDEISLKEVIKFLLVENETEEKDNDNEFLDEKQEHQQQSDFIKESFKIAEKDGNIDVNMLKELAKKYNVQLK